MINREYGVNDNPNSGQPEPEITGDEYDSQITTLESQLPALSDSIDDAIADLTPQLTALQTRVDDITEALTIASNWILRVDTDPTDEAIEIWFNTTEELLKIRLDNGDIQCVSLTSVGYYYYY